MSYRRKRQARTGGRSRCLAVLLSAAVGTFGARLAKAQTLTWNNPAGGIFTVAADWTPNAVPGTANNCFFNLNSSYGVIFSATAQTAGLTVSAGTVQFTSNGGPFRYTDTAGLMVTAATLSLGTLNLTDTVGATNVQAGGLLNVLAGASATLGGVSIATTAPVGASGGAIVIDGATANLVASNLIIGQNGNGGQLAIQNGADATFTGTITLTNSGVTNSNSTLTVASGGSLLTNAISAGVGSSVGQTTSISVSGAGSTLTVSPAVANTITLGASTNSTTSLNIASGGTMSTGTGAMTVNKTATVILSNGTLNLNGDLMVSGGIVNVGGTLTLPANHSLSVSGGGNFTTSLLSLTTPAGYAVNVNGAGSRFNIFPSFTLANNATLSVGTASPGASFFTAFLTINNGTAIVDGAGTTLTVNSGISNETVVTLGGSAAAASLTVRNSATASFNGSLSIASTGSSTASLSVLSGADVTLGGSISVGTSSANGSTGSLTVSGAGSSLVQTGSFSSSFTIGPTSGAAGTASVSVDSSAKVTSGGGTFTINPRGMLSVTNSASFTALGATSLAGGTISLASGGTFNANSDVDIGTGGQLSGNVANFLLAAGADLTVHAGGRADLLGVNGFELNTNSRLTIGDGFPTTAGPAIFNMPTGALVVDSGNFITIFNGSITADSLLFGVESGNPVFADVFGTGASLVLTNAHNLSLLGLTTGSQGSLTVESGATASFAGGVAIGVGDNVTGSLSVLSGAKVTIAGPVFVGNGNAGVGTITVSGAASTLTANSTAASLLLSSSTLFHDVGVNVLDGGALDYSAGSVEIDGGSQIMVNGGFADLGALTTSFGGIIVLVSGAVSFTGTLSVSTNGTFGPAPTLSQNQSITVRGPTVIDPFHTLTLSGGSLATDSLTIGSGTFAFNSGTLTLTGANALTFSPTGPFGSTFALGAARTLAATSLASMAPGSLVMLAGGTLNAVGGLTNSGEIRFTSAASLLTGGTLTNNKLIDGSGLIGNVLINAPGGEVRAANTDRLTFLATSTHTNAGKLTLQNGGTLEFDGPLVNSGSGLITGAGFLYAPSIANAGKMTFTAGDTVVSGPVTNTSGSVTTITSGGTTTFLDPFALPAGATLQVSANSAAYFEASVTGGGIFSGTGLKVFDAGSSTLATIASVTGSTTVDAAARVTVQSLAEASLTVAGEVSTVAGISAPASRVNALSIIDGGSYDLADKDLIVDYTGASPAASVRAYIAGAFNGGTWDQPGLTSSVAKNSNGGRSLGYAEASDLGIATFDGQAVDPSTLLVKSTYAGDSNLDGKVDLGNDFNLFLQGFLSPSASSWVLGDYNYDGNVDSSDFGLFIDGYKSQTTSLGGLDQVIEFSPLLSVAQKAQLLSAVPEPSAISLLAIAFPFAARRRR
jgi:fibronectin-binding autotransporter adhesin